MTNTPDKSEMKSCPSIDVRASILTTIKANREAGESQEVLARDLTTLFHKLFASSRPPADQVPDMVDRLVTRIAEHAVMELDADEENTLQIEAFGKAVEREILAALQAVPAASGLTKREEHLARLEIRNALGPSSGSIFPEPPALKASKGTGE